MVTFPPALAAPVVLSTPLVSIVPVRLTLPLPLMVMLRSPEAWPLLSAAVVVMLLSEAMFPATAVNVTSPPTVVMP